MYSIGIGLISILYNPVAAVILLLKGHLSSWFRVIPHEIRMLIDTIKYNFVGQQFTDPCQLLQFIRRDVTDNRHYCTICESFSHKIISHTRNHVEAKHFPDSFVYKCDLCPETLKNAIALNNHRSKRHKYDKHHRPIDAEVLMGK